MNKIREYIINEGYKLASKEFTKALGVLSPKGLAKLGIKRMAKGKYGPKKLVTKKLVQRFARRKKYVIQRALRKKPWK